MLIIFGFGCEVGKFPVESLQDMCMTISKPFWAFSSPSIERKVGTNTMTDPYCTINAYICEENLTYCKKLHQHYTMSRQEEFTNFINLNFDDFDSGTKMHTTFQNINGFSQFFLWNAGMILPHN